MRALILTALMAASAPAALAQNVYVTADRMLDVATGLSANAKVQVLATTHSPFVPLSVETEVDTHDRLWDLDLVNAEASLSLRKWEVRGDAMAWATSMCALPWTCV